MRFIRKKTILVASVSPREDWFHVSNHLDCYLETVHFSLDHGVSQVIIFFYGLAKLRKFMHKVALYSLEN